MTRRRMENATDEEIARAVCMLHGQLDPDEVMKDGTPRWRYWLHFVEPRRAVDRNLLQLMNQKGTSQ